MRGAPLAIESCWEERSEPSMYQRYGEMIQKQMRQFFSQFLWIPWVELNSQLFDLSWIWIVSGSVFMLNMNTLKSHLSNYSRTKNNYCIKSQLCTSPVSINPPHAIASGISLFFGRGHRSSGSILLYILGVGSSPYLSATPTSLSLCSGSISARALDREPMSELGSWGFHMIIAKLHPIRMESCDSQRTQNFGPAVQQFWQFWYFGKFHSFGSQTIRRSDS